MCKNIMFLFQTPNEIYITITKCHFHIISTELTIQENFPPGAVPRPLGIEMCCFYLVYSVFQQNSVILCAYIQI